VYIEIESDNDENDSSNNIISNNAFDILNKTQFNDYMDDELIKDYLENCKDDNNSEKIETDSDSSKINQNDVIIDEKSEQSDEEHDIEFLNSAFAKNIIKSDVGVETEPVEMEMDLIKLLENKLPSDDSSSSSENSEVEYISVKDDKKSIQKNTNSSVKNRNKKNKKNKKGKRNNKQKVNNNSKQLNMDIEVDNNVPVINIEDVVIELDKEPDLKDNQETFNIDSPSVIIEEKSNEIILENEDNTKNNKQSEIIEINDNNNNNNDIDIISLLESSNNDNKDDAVLISDDESVKIINSVNSNDTISDDDAIVISEDSNSENSEDSEENGNEDSEDEDEDEDIEDSDIDNDIMELNDSIFKPKDGQRKLLINDENDDNVFNDNFEGGDSSWDLDDKGIVEKIKNSKFKAILNSDQDKLLRLQKKKLQKKELAQKKEYLLQKKENLSKENKRIQKVLKSKKGNKLNCSPEVFKYLKHINTTIKEFVINGFESIPLGNLPSELRKSVGMIAMEYNVKIKTRGSGKRKITNLIRTSRSRIPDNWNSIVETVFSKTESQRHSNMDVRKRNLDMAKRRGKYHNNNRGKSSVNKPELGSKVGENANPISNSNKGFKLLQSMGWTPGESLGSNNSSGIINPIEVVVRDQSGLGASYFDQGYNQASSSSNIPGGTDLDDISDEYERDILYNSRSSSSIFSNKNKGKNKRFSSDNFGVGKKSNKNSLKNKSRIGETGGLENAPYSFVNFQKGSSLFTSDEIN